MLLFTLSRSSIFRGFVFFLVTMFCMTAKGQQQRYDIVGHVPPVKYQKEFRDNAVLYVFTNIQDSTWCQIAIFKNTVSLGSIDKDFDADWQELVVKQYMIKDSAVKEEVQEADGWQIMSGSVEWMFGQKPVATILTTVTGYNARVSFLVNTNAAKYLQDFVDMMATIDLQKPSSSSTTPIPKQMPAQSGQNTSAVEGVWIKAGSVSPVYGDASSWGASGSTKDQYIFHANGTYEFYSKMFAYSNNQLILVRETGTLVVDGNRLTLDPSFSVVEAWSKKNNTDQWGVLISSVSRPFERTTYTFTRHYFSGIQEWNLILQTQTKTNRDGEFGQNPTFNNAYFYSPASKTNTPIVLPK